MLLQETQVQIFHGTGVLKKGEGNTEDSVVKWKLRVYKYRCVTVMYVTDACRMAGCMTYCI